MLNVPTPGRKVSDYLETHVSCLSADFIIVYPLNKLEAGPCGSVNTPLLTVRVWVTGIILSLSAEQLTLLMDFHSLRLRVKVLVFLFPFV